MACTDQPHPLHFSYSFASPHALCNLRTSKQQLRLCALFPPFARPLLRRRPTAEPPSSLSRFLTEASSSRSSAGREDGSCRVWRVLEAAPALVPFAERARLFQLMVAREREVSVRSVPLQGDGYAAGLRGCVGMGWRQSSRGPHPPACQPSRS